MKKKDFLWSKLVILMVGLMSVCLCACGDDDEPAPTPEPTPTPASITIRSDKTSLEFEAVGGKKEIQITSNSGWTLSGLPSWVEADKTSFAPNSSGEQTTTVVLTASARSTDSGERKATLTFTTTTDNKTTTVEVSQKLPAAEILVNGVKAAEVAPFPGNFGNKSGVDFKEPLTVKSNVEWTATGVPDWLYMSQLKGNGDVQISIYPREPNPTATVRSSEIILTGGGAQATIKVTQGEGLPSVKVTPVNTVALYNQIGWELEASGAVDKYRMICVIEAVYQRKTEKELIADLQTDEAEKLSNNPVFFYDSDSYGNDIKPNTTYYICTLAYDEKDQSGELVKTKVKTPAFFDYNNDAHVSFSDIRRSSTAFQFTVTKEGYCDTYHIIYGNLPQRFVNFNKVLYAFEINYFINHRQKHWIAEQYSLEITLNYPNSHTFTYSPRTSLAINPVAMAYGWGVFSDGRLSSDMLGFAWDTSTDSSRQLKAEAGAETLKGNVMLTPSGMKVLTSNLSR